MDKVGRYPFMAEPFHCDFSHRLFMGHLGNHLLNAADFHSADRDFGMTYLNQIHKTWVLSRLAVEMEEMPVQYTKFFVETWVESAMKFFTNRNFRIVGSDETIYGYGRSVWAMIDTGTRQPQDILAVHDGAINQWIEKARPCPIEKGGRVKMGDGAELVRIIDTYYTDVDVNGHVNSVKYIEHVLDLWDVAWYREHRIKRFEIAYVAEAHQGDRLGLYREMVSGPDGEGAVEFNIRIMKIPPGSTESVEVCRSKVRFVRG